MRKAKTAGGETKPFTRPPRIVAVTTSIIQTQEQLTSISKRLDVIDAEASRLTTEHGELTTVLSGLQREMDKLTAMHHVQQQ